MSAGKAAATRRTNKYQEDQRVPVAWTGKAADAFEATRRRLEAEKAAREAADTSPPVFGQGTPTFVQEAKRLEGRPADELAAELHQAASKVTKTQRRKAAKAADAVPAGDPGLKALLEAVEKKRQAMQTNEQAVEKERYRDAYRRDVAVTT
jgi:flagellar hook-basal body complex protein FliE